MIFKNREHAAHLLSGKLMQYKEQKDVLVLGLARGGGVLAYHIAKDLGVDFNFLIPRKLQAVGQKELAIGAISEKGHLFLHRALMFELKIPDCYLKQEVLRQKKEILKKEKKFRKFMPFPDVAGKTIILVDDGMATGSTILAELEFLKSQNIQKLIVAVPVSATDAWERVQMLVDDAVCLEVEDSFQSISQYYRDFNQVDDEEFLALLKS